MDKNEAKQIDRELTFLERTELGGKIAAVSLPLTYVSGYLIYTSYLGTYGIQLGYSDLLRSKYIYIGFLYLVFLAAIVAVFRTGMRIAEMNSVMKRKTQDEARSEFDTERQKSLAALLQRNVVLDRWVRRRFQEYRGDFVVALLVSVFAVEVIFLNPEHLGILLPLQIVYLMGVAIYQFTFYRELREPYTWGLVYGRKYVEDCRWWLCGAQLVAALGLAVFAVSRGLVELSALTPFGHGWETRCERVAWTLAAVALEMEWVGGAAVLVSTNRLSELDRIPRFKPEWPEPRAMTVREGLEIRKSIWGVIVGYITTSAVGFWKKLFDRVARPAMLLFLPILLFLFYSKWRDDAPTLLRLVLVFAPLVLSLFVLGNVAL
jgi:hypothetical protein